MKSLKNTKAAKVALAAAAIIATVSALPTHAEAAGCRDVYIEVINESGAPIEVYDIDYFDYSPGRWRSEPVRDRVIGDGQSWVFNRKLEGVGGEETYLRVEYRESRAGRFRGFYDAFSAVDYCYRGSSYQVVIE